MRKELAFVGLGSNAGIITRYGVEWAIFLADAGPVRWARNTRTSEWSICQLVLCSDGAPAQSGIEHFDGEVPETVGRTARRVERVALTDLRAEKPDDIGHAGDFLCGVSLTGR